MQSKTVQARLAFFSAIDHTDARHFGPHLALTEETTARISAATLRAGAADLASLEGGCGWWWCAAKPDVPLWEDLVAALRVLRAARIDPWSAEVASVGELHRRVHSWAGEEEGLSKLAKALGGLTLEGHARILRQEWLARIAPLLKNARACSPRAVRGHPRDVPQQEALALAATHGWSSKEAAAALLLTGAVKISFAALRDSVSKAFPRRDEAAGKTAAPVKRIKRAP